MSILGTYIKQPAERLDLSVDFSEWLENLTGDSLISATSSVDDAGLTIDIPIVASPIVQQWYEGGVDGARYKVTITVITALGRIKQVEFYVRVKDY